MAGSISALDELSQQPIDWFPSGRLESEADVTVPDGYSPPSLSKRKWHHPARIEKGTYCGALERDKPHGFGTAVWPLQRVYDGEWVEGKESGVGREAWLTGSCYAGELKDGLRSGYGVYVHCASADGARTLAGAQQDADAVSGFSALRKKIPWCSVHPFSDRWLQARAGWVYAGQFKFGGRHGLGALADSNGELFEVRVSSITSFFASVGTNVSSPAE